MGHLLTVLQKNKIIVQDGFNRPDNTTSLGNANTGQTWVVTPVGANFGIINSQAYRNYASAGDVFAVLDSRVSDGIIKISVPVNSAGAKIVFRYTDDNNLFAIENDPGYYGLWRKQASVWTEMARYTTNAAANDKLKVILRGNSIGVYINGVLRISFSDSFNASATKHGISSQNNNDRFDNFSVEGF